MSLYLCAHRSKGQYKRLGRHVLGLRDEATPFVVYTDDGEWWTCQRDVYLSFSPQSWWQNIWSPELNLLLLRKL